MTPEPPPSPDPPRWEENPLGWPRASGHVDALLAAVAVRERRRRRHLLAASTALVALVCIGVFTVTRSPRASDSSRAAPRTVVTAPERRTLPDGTLVELRPGADLVVNFTAAAAGPRRVALRHGEALFHVAKNPARPFVVSAGGSDFRAVGTAFAVNLAPDSVALLVTEGRVAVAPTATPASAAAEATPIVEAGFRVVISQTAATPPAIAAVTPAESQTALAWRVPRLEFSSTPLTEVVRLLNEHSGTRLRLASPELGRVEISGALRANNLDPLFQILRTTYRVEAARQPDGAIILHSTR